MLAVYIRDNIFEVAYMNADVRQWLIDNWERVDYVKDPFNNSLTFENISNTAIYSNGANYRNGDIIGIYVRLISETDVVFFKLKFS